MAIHQLTISELGPQGDGIHDDERGRVYVERGLPGDEVDAEVYWDDAGIPRGEIAQLLQPSPYRQDPPCPHYDHCGNCTLQHAQTGFYRQWKTQVVQDAIRRQGLHPKRWLDTVFLDQTHNRRRATFAALKKNGRVTMGYYRRRSQAITAIDSCLVAKPKLLELRDALAPLLATVLPEGRSADVFLQLVGDAVDMVITGPIGRRGTLDEESHISLEALLATAPITRLAWRASARDEARVIGQHAPIVATFGGLKVALPPAAFLQPTAEGERALVDAVMAALPATGKFADLFSGCGTFTGPMLARGAVDAFESADSAVRALTQAAGRQPLRAVRRDLFQHPLTVDEIQNYDAVVFDPPRAGAAEQVSAIASAKVPVLIGVSCNPATFARDARLLREGGYRLETIQPIDQFQWSHHVEVVGVFKRVTR